MERKQLKQFARLAALLLFAAILAGCTATPDTTVNTQNGAGTLDNVPFPVRGGTATDGCGAIRIERRKATPPA